MYIHAYTILYHITSISATLTSVKSLFTLLVANPLTLNTHPDFLFAYSILTSYIATEGEKGFFEVFTVPHVFHLDLGLTLDFTRTCFE